jgi:hypothetical protein
LELLNMLGLKISSKSVMKSSEKSKKLFLFISCLAFLDCHAYGIEWMINQTSS